MISLDVLKTSDIDEKIKLNEDTGLDVYALRESIKQELKQFEWTVLRAQIQCQCYKEQLEHIENRVKEFELTGVKTWLSTAQ